MTSKPANTTSITPLEAARLAVDVASDKQATDIVLLDVAEVSGFTDFMVVMSGGTARQLTALANDVEEGIGRAGLKLHHREGTPSSGWVLLDFGDLVIHLFSDDRRAFYKLEQVWAQARTVVRIQ